MSVLSAESTRKTDYQALSFFTVTAEGCTVRYGIEQAVYRLAASHAQYNAMYSLLLAAWVESAPVSLEYRLLSAFPGSSETPPREIVGVTSMPRGMAAG